MTSRSPDTGSGSPIDDPYRNRRDDPSRTRGNGLAIAGLVVGIVAGVGAGAAAVRGCNTNDRVSAVEADVKTRAEADKTRAEADKVRDGDVAKLKDDLNPNKDGSFAKTVTSELDPNNPKGVNGRVGLLEDANTKQTPLVVKLDVANLCREALKTGTPKPDSKTGFVTVKSTIDNQDHQCPKPTAGPSNGVPGAATSQPRSKENPGGFVTHAELDRAVKAQAARDKKQDEVRDSHDGDLANGLDKVDAASKKRDVDLANGLDKEASERKKDTQAIAKSTSINVTDNNPDTCERLTRMLGNTPAGCSTTNPSTKTKK